MAGHATSKPLTRGLEFGRHVYSKPSDKVEAEAKEAYNIFERKLPALSQLNALISVVVEGNSPVFIDGRPNEGPALLRTDTTEEPDAKLEIKPKYIILFARDGVEPRFALFKGAFSIEGNPVGAIKFLDLLAPNPPSPVKNYTPEAFPRLPQATEDLDQVKRDIEEFGYGMVKNALSPEEVAILRKAVDEQAAGEIKDETAQSWEGRPETMQQVWVLSNKGDEFLDMLNHPLIDEVVPWLLGDNAHLHGYLANIARPGNTPMPVHTDQLTVQPSIRDIPFGMNILWFLTDFTKEKGGTRLYPGSHRGNVAPKDPLDISGSVAAEGPAGTALIYESRLWHTTGPNRDPNGAARPAIIMVFMRSFVRQQENFALSLRPEVAGKLSERHKRLLGLYSTDALNGIDGDMSEGIYAEKKNDCRGRNRVQL